MWAVSSEKLRGTTALPDKFICSKFVWVVLKGIARTIRYLSLAPKWIASIGNKCHLYFLEQENYSLSNAFDGALMKLFLVSAKSVGQYREGIFCGHEMCVGTGEVVSGLVRGSGVSSGWACFGLFTAWCWQAWRLTESNLQACSMCAAFFGCFFFFSLSLPKAKTRMAKWNVSTISAQQFCELSRCACGFILTALYLAVSFSISKLIFLTTQTQKYCQASLLNFLTFFTGGQTWAGTWKSILRFFFCFFFLPPSRAFCCFRCLFSVINV